jgi:hypothetical protein
VQVDIGGLNQGQGQVNSQKTNFFYVSLVRRFSSKAFKSSYDRPLAGTQFTVAFEYRGIMT